MFDATKAERAIKFIQNLKHTKGKFHGQPFQLLPWEDKIIRDVYGTLNERGVRQYQHVYVEVPKKNGKSELAAAAGLYHLFFDGEIMGEVYGCAADREQASIVFNVAVEMIEQVPALKKRAKLNLSTKRITDRETGTFYQVLSSESFTKHGLNVSAVIFDEIHAQPNRELYDVMTFGAGDAREQPIWWVITTAGNDPDRVSIGWEVHEKAAKILAGDIVDPLWYPVIFAYDGDDIYNPENWKKANPSLGQTFSFEKVQDAANTAMQSKANERLFRWLRLNQWLTSKLTTWQDVSLFDQTVGAWDRRDLLGRDCYVGLDLSSTTDLSATALIFPPQGDQYDWRVIWDAWIPANGIQERIEKDHVPYDLWQRNGWIQATEGDVISYLDIKERILEYKKLYNVKEMPLDRTFSAMLVQELEKEGLVCVDIAQTYALLTDPINLVEVLLKQGKMTHEPNPVARWAFGNVSIAMNGNAQKKFVKESRGKSVVRTKRIDPMAALFIGMARAKFFVGKIDLSLAILDPEWGM
jgi:phage terminase large subunit-like protein